MSKKISLRQFLMKTGRFERVSDCVHEIREGKITVNGKKITNPNHFFSIKNPLIRIENEKTRKVAMHYFLLNKPAGYVSQKSENDDTIYDLLKTSGMDDKNINSLFAVGRLDKDTEGLMIMTNDGALSNIVTDPKNEIYKRYHAVLENPLDYESIKTLEKGIFIETDEGKYKTKKCKIRISGKKEAYISIMECKKRQIRKMFEAIGNKVVYLKRVSIGGLQLGKLNSGEIRQITKEEIMEKLEF